MNNTESLLCPFCHSLMIVALVDVPLQKTRHKRCNQIVWLEREERKVVRTYKSSEVFVDEVSGALIVKKDIENDVLKDIDTMHKTFNEKEGKNGKN